MAQAEATELAALEKEALQFFLEAEGREKQELKLHKSKKIEERHFMRLLHYIIHIPVATCI